MLMVHETDRDAVSAITKLYIVPAFPAHFFIPCHCCRLVVAESHVATRIKKDAGGIRVDFVHIIVVVASRGV